jgi:hypothetical protein
MDFSYSGVDFLCAFDGFCARIETWMTRRPCHRGNEHAEIQLPRQGDGVPSEWPVLGAFEQRIGPQERNNRDDPNICYPQGHDSGS